jgi:CDP-diacylglycerol--glycerol-3-phosphate 3-phosphatidyltransferase
VRHVPNILTVSRCVFAALTFWGLYQAHALSTSDTASTEASVALRHLWLQVACLSFVSGALTDLIDGWAARKLKAESRFGIWLDPIADKLLVGGALIGLGALFDNITISMPAGAIIARDIFMTWLRTRPEGKRVVSPSPLAKWKTALEMAAIFSFLLPLGLFPLAGASDFKLLAKLAGTLGVTLLWLAAIMSLYTGWQYMRAVRP